MNQPVAEELREFHRFVGQKLSQGPAKLSPEEALEEWRELHPDPAEADRPSEVVQAVRQALADMEAGDKGTPARDVVAELRSRLLAQRLGGNRFDFGDHARAEVR